MNTNIKSKDDAIYYYTVYMHVKLSEMIRQGNKKYATDISEASTLTPEEVISLAGDDLGEIWLEVKQDYKGIYIAIREEYVHLKAMQVWAEIEYRWEQKHQSSNDNEHQ